MPAVENLPFATIITPGQRPENLHLLTWDAQQREAAAALVKPVKPWQPMEPKPEPEIVRRRREAAAKMAQDAAQATAAATAADQEATALKHEITRQEQIVRSLELRLSRLTAIDFKAQAAAAEATLEAALENVDNADPSRHSERLILQTLRAEKLETIRQSALKKVRAELSAAQRMLSELTEANAA
jgi:hypothetical protein